MLGVALVPKIFYSNCFKISSKLKMSKFFCNCKYYLFGVTYIHYPGLFK